MQYAHKNVIETLMGKLFNYLFVKKSDLPEFL